MKMTCWNCHGLSSSPPYINSFLQDGSKILVLLEHWFWLYDLYKLSEINDEYDTVGKSDMRLTDEREGSRGYG